MGSLTDGLVVYYLYFKWRFNKTPLDIIMSHFNLRQ